MPWFHYKNNYSQATAFKYAKFTDGEMQEMTAMRLKVEARWHSMPPRRTLNIQTVTAGRPLLILSLDGGGVKGTMTAEIIKRLAEKYPGLLASIDVFAGTSAGSLLATMFAYGYTADEAAYVFEKFVPKLFNYTCFRVAKRIANIYKSKYSNKNLIAAANALFGNATYGDLRKHLVTVSLDLSNPGRKYDPVAHHSFPPQFGERHNPDAMLYFNGFKSVSEACIQSAAAPTFFPTYKGHADGGMFANNPALIATCIVLGQSRDLNRSHIHVLSVSTGHPEPGVTGLHLEGDQKWGVRQWLPNIIDTCMESGNNYTQEVMTDARAPALLASAPFALVLADARAPALLEFVHFTLVRADACTPALLALAPDALVLADAGNTPSARKFMQNRPTDRPRIRFGCH